jgi:hypothetical protein
MRQSSPAIDRAQGPRRDRRGLARSGSCGFQFPDRTRDIALPQVDLSDVVIGIRVPRVPKLRPRERLQRLFEAAQPVQIECLGQCIGRRCGARGWRRARVLGREHRHGDRTRRGTTYSVACEDGHFRSPNRVGRPLRLAPVPVDLSRADPPFEFYRVAVGISCLCNERHHGADSHGTRIAPDLDSWWTVWSGSGSGRRRRWSRRNTRSAECAS